MKSVTELRVTRPDAVKIAHLVQRLSAERGEQADVLQDLLDLAQIVASEHIPPEVATLDSQVLIKDDARNHTMRITLVLPQAANPGAGRISIVSPMGRALLGRQVGDVVDVSLPTGETRQVRLQAILYQPEANGVHETA